MHTASAPITGARVVAATISLAKWNIRSLPCIKPLVLFTPEEPWKVQLLKGTEQHRVLLLLLPMLMPVLQQRSVRVAAFHLRQRHRWAQQHWLMPVSCN
jgi:hypothetical protein